MLTQATIAEHLDLSVRRVRMMLQDLDIDHQQSTLAEIRVRYIQDLREKAAGRGGNAYMAAKQREAELKGDKLEIEKFERLKLLVPIAELEPILESWAVTSRSEIQNTVEKLIASIQSEHNLDIDKQLIDDALQTAFNALRDYPHRHVGDAYSSGREICSTGTDSDTGMGEA